MWGGQSCPQLSHTCQPHMKGYPAGSLCPYLARLQRSWLAHDGDRIQIHNCTRNYYVLPLLDLPLCQRGCLIQPLQPCYRRPGCTAVSAAGSRCCSRPQPAAEEGREGLQQAAGGRSCSRLLLVAEGGRGRRIAGMPDPGPRPGRRGPGEAGQLSHAAAATASTRGPSARAGSHAAMQALHQAHQAVVSEGLGEGAAVARVGGREGWGGVKGCGS